MESACTAKPQARKASIIGRSAVSRLAALRCRLTDHYRPAFASAQDAERPLQDCHQAPQSGDLRLELCDPLLVRNGRQRHNWNTTIMEGNGAEAGAPTNRTRPGRNRTSRTHGRGLCAEASQISA
jgi:hypothetical protein